MRIGLGQQLPDQFLRLVVISLTKMMSAYMPLRIDKIMCRPVLIVESLPDGVVVIESHRILIPRSRTARFTCFVLFKCKFRK